MQRALRVWLCTGSVAARKISVHVQGLTEGPAACQTFEIQERASDPIARVVRMLCSTRHWGFALPAGASTRSHATEVLPSCTSPLEIHVAPPHSRCPAGPPEGSQRRREGLGPSGFALCEKRRSASR